MAIHLNTQEQLILDENTKTHQGIPRLISQLNNDTFFTNPSMNLWGRRLVQFLCANFYLDYQNPEPLNTEKNTLIRVLNQLRLIDYNIQKPLEEYTSSDLNEFMTAFQEGRAKQHTPSMRPLKKSAIISYVREFKRLWRIYRYHRLTKDNTTNLAALEWGVMLKPPRVKREYEKYEMLSPEQVIRLANQHTREEYTIRTLLSVNLMGRKCEMTELERADIEEREGGRVWVKLPNVKKNSSEKVPVELYTFVKKPLMEYLNAEQFNPDDKIFQSDETAYARDLRIKSEKTLKQRVTPKTLRKIGVCVAEGMGYSRADVERIGGWSANSPVIAHYFNRGKGVELRTGADTQIDRAVHKDLYAEFDRVQAQSKRMEEQLSVIAALLGDDKRADKLRELLAKTA